GPRCEAKGRCDPRLGDGKGPASRPPQFARPRLRGTPFEPHQNPISRAPLSNGADLQSRSRLVLPAQRVPVELAAVERSENNYPSKPLVRWKTESYVER